MKLSNWFTSSWCRLARVLLHHFLHRCCLSYLERADSCRHHLPPILELLFLIQPHSQVFQSYVHQRKPFWGMSSFLLCSLLLATYPCTELWSKPFEQFTMATQIGSQQIEHTHTVGRVWASSFRMTAVKAIVKDSAWSCWWEGHSSSQFERQRRRYARLHLLWSCFLHWCLYL